MLVPFASYANDCMLSFCPSRLSVVSKRRWDLVHVEEHELADAFSRIAETLILGKGSEQSLSFHILGPLNLVSYFTVMFFQVPLLGIHFLLNLY